MAEITEPWVKPPGPTFIVLRKTQTSTHISACVFFPAVYPSVSIRLNGLSATHTHSTLTLRKSQRQWAKIWTHLLTLKAKNLSSVFAKSNLISLAFKLCCQPRREGKHKVFSTLCQTPGSNSWLNIYGQRTWIPRPLGHKQDGRGDLCAGDDIGMTQMYRE